MEARTLLLFKPPAETLDLHTLGWHIVTAEDNATAQRLINKHHIQVAIYCFPNTPMQQEHDAVLESLLCANQQIYWVALVEQMQSDNQRVYQYISTWFYDYHTLPLSLKRLEPLLGHALGMAKLAQRTSLKIQKNMGWHGMIGNSKVMLNLFHSIEKISDSLAPVMITGESGTGKELVAQAIHANSRCRGNAIIEVNCGAIPRDLIQSEFFGHEKGAFSGASQRKIGSIEAAHGGTLFLDEIGDLPLELQVNLLRFIQEGVIQRLGSNEKIPVNVRIIAATHVDLEKAIGEGSFREDLYYRLNVLHLSTPPLHTRGNDIIHLAQYFLEKFRAETRRKITSFNIAAIDAIKAHSWPGNVRELQNRVRRAIVMSEGHIISAEDLCLQAPKESEHEQLNLEEIRNHSELNAIHRALFKTEYNISQAAKLLGISRRNLYRLMDKHSITPASSVPQRLM